MKDMKVMKDMKNMFGEKLKKLEQEGAQMFENAIDSNINRIKGDIEKKVNSMTSGGSGQEVQEQMQRVEVDENEYLKFISDDRKLTSLTIFAFSLFLLTILPGWAKVIPCFVFLVALASLMTSYINKCTVNVDEGFNGVITNWGEPTGELQKPGRIWYWTLNRFCTFQVSNHDLFANVQVTNYTLDFGQMTIAPQVTFEIFDQKRFIKTTTPAGTIKFIKLYSNYIGLRLITSMSARSKFIGTKDMKNFKDALDRYMNKFGIRVKYVTLPNVQNPVLDDLEYVQTKLRKINELGVSKAAERENAVKTIETEIRSKTKATRGTSNELNQKRIELETILDSELSSAKQKLVVDARSQLIQAHSALLRDIATFLAKVRKNQALGAMLSSLQLKHDLALAKAKRVAYEALIPETINVINVKGMEAGLLMHTAAKIFGAHEKGASIPKEKLLPVCLTEKTVEPEVI